MPIVRTIITLYNEWDVFIEYIFIYDMLPHSDYIFDNFFTTVNLIYQISTCF